VIFLLDTNAVTALVRETPSFMEKRLGYAADDFCISSIVAFEILFGIYKARPPLDPRNFDQLGLEILPFDAEDARAAGEIRALLTKRGTPIGPYDVLIAGQALARDLTLITRNVGEFSRVDGLRIENWMN
jgi:tRNA(fMet)-specific endonuclease VapC